MYGYSDPRGGGLCEHNIMPIDLREWLIDQAESMLINILRQRRSPDKRHPRIARVGRRQHERSAESA